LVFVGDRPLAIDFLHHINPAVIGIGSAWRS